MNAKRTLAILAIASSLGMSTAWSAPAQDNDEDRDGHQHNSQTEQNSTDEHHQEHGPRDMDHGPMMGHGSMHRGMNGMSEERRHMMREHREMLSKLKSEQADLDKKLEKMNSSTGQEKIEAMSAVINQMANDRKEMLAHMQSMHKRMMAHMDRMRSMMPNPEHEPAGAPNHHHEEEENK